MTAFFKKAAEKAKIVCRGGASIQILGRGDEVAVDLQLILIVQPELNVYKAAEWTSVALLSQLSVTNKGRTFEVPNFRANMPWEEKRITI